jgi:metal-sulfur cluster biosynthetic enzyme
MARQEGRGPGRRGFRCECGGVIGVSRTCPVEDGVLVRYRSCRRCSRGHKSVEVLVDDFNPRLSVDRIARAVRRLLSEETQDRRRENT